MLLCFESFTGPPILLETENFSAFIQLLLLLFIIIIILLLL